MPFGVVVVWSVVVVEFCSSAVLSALRMSGVMETLRVTPDSSDTQLRHENVSVTPGAQPLSHPFEISAPSFAICSGAKLETAKSWINWQISLVLQDVNIQSKLRKWLWVCGGWRL